MMMMMTVIMIIIIIMVMMAMMELALKKFQEMHFTPCVVILVIKSTGLPSTKN